MQKRNHFGSKEKKILSSSREQIERFLPKDLASICLKYYSSCQERSSSLLPCLNAEYNIHTDIPIEKKLREIGVLGSNGFRNTGGEYSKIIVNIFHFSADDKCDFNFRRRYLWRLLLISEVVRENANNVTIKHYYFNAYPLTSAVTQALKRLKAKKIKVAKGYDNQNYLAFKRRVKSREELYHDHPLDDKNVSKKLAEKVILSWIKENKDKFNVTKISAYFCELVKSQIMQSRIIPKGFETSFGFFFQEEKELIIDEWKKRVGTKQKNAYKGKDGKPTVTLLSNEEWEIYLILLAVFLPPSSWRTVVWENNNMHSYILEHISATKFSYLVFPLLFSLKDGQVLAGQLFNEFLMFRCEGAGEAKKIKRSNNDVITSGRNMINAGFPDIEIEEARSNLLLSPDQLQRETQKNRIERLWEIVCAQPKDKRFRFRFAMNLQEIKLTERRRGPVCLGASDYLLKKFSGKHCRIELPFVNFAGSEIIGVSFAHANLGGACFRFARLIDVNFFGANIARADFGNMRGMAGCTMFSLLTNTSVVTGNVHFSFVNRQLANGLRKKLNGLRNKQIRQRGEKEQQNSSRRPRQTSLPPPLSTSSSSSTSCSSFDLIGSSQSCPSRSSGTSSGVTYTLPPPWVLKKHQGRPSHSVASQSLGSSSSSTSSLSSTSCSSSQLAPFSRKRRHGLEGPGQGSFMGWTGHRPPPGLSLGTDERSTPMAIDEKTKYGTEAWEVFHEQKDSWKRGLVNYVKQLCSFLGKTYVPHKFAIFLASLRNDDSFCGRFYDLMRADRSVEDDFLLLCFMPLNHLFWAKYKKNRINEPCYREVFEKLEVSKLVVDNGLYVNDEILKMILDDQKENLTFSRAAQVFNLQGAIFDEENLTSFLYYEIDWNVVNLRGARFLNGCCLGGSRDCRLECCKHKHKRSQGQSGRMLLPSNKRQKR